MASGNSLDPSFGDGTKEGVDPKLGDVSDSTTVPLPASELHSSPVSSGQHLDAAGNYLQALPPIFRTKSILPAEPILHGGDHNILKHQVETQEIGHADLTGTASDIDIPEEKKSGAITITMLPQTASNHNDVHDVELVDRGSTIDHGSLQPDQPKTVGIPPPQEQVPSVEATIHSEDEKIHPQPSTSANKPLTKDALLSESTEEPSQKLPQHPAEVSEPPKDDPKTLGADHTLPKNPEVHLNPTQKDSHHGKGSEVTDGPRHGEDAKDSEGHQKGQGQKEKPAKMREVFTQLQQYLPKSSQKGKADTGADAPTTAASTAEPPPDGETPTTGKDTAVKETSKDGKLQRGKSQSARNWAFGKKAAETAEPEDTPADEETPGEGPSTSGKLQKGVIQSARSWAFGKKAAETAEAEDTPADEDTAGEEPSTSGKLQKGVIQSARSWAFGKKTETAEPEDTPTDGETPGEGPLTPSKLQKGVIQGAKSWAFGKKGTETAEPSDPPGDGDAPGEPPPPDKLQKGKIPGARRLFGQKTGAGDDGDTVRLRF